MTLIQLLFVERIGTDVVIDGVLAEAGSATELALGTPVTVRLRLPSAPEWRRRFTAMLHRWAAEGQMVQVELRVGRNATVAQLAARRAKLTLDVVDA